MSSWLILLFPTTNAPTLSHPAPESNEFLPAGTAQDSALHKKTCGERSLLRKAQAKKNSDGNDRSPQVSLCLDSKFRPGTIAARRGRGCRWLCLDSKFRPGTIQRQRGRIGDQLCLDSKFRPGTM